MFDWWNNNIINLEQCDILANTITLSSPTVSGRWKQWISYTSYILIPKEPNKDVTPICSRQYNLSTCWVYYQKRDPITGNKIP